MSVDAPGLQASIIWRNKRVTKCTWQDKERREDQVLCGWPPLTTVSKFDGLDARCVVSTCVVPGKAWPASRCQSTE